MGEIRFGEVDDAIASSGFSGVVRVDVDGATAYERAVGWADRAWSIPMAVDTRLATASAAKGVTALTVLSLVADGVLALDTPARSLLGGGLPLVDDRVTVEHLLTHRSGIGDYLDEDELGSVDDHVLRSPLHRLDTAEDFIAEIDGHPQVSPPGERFAYNNGGFVLLGLLAARAAGRGYHDLVQERVLDPAGMAASGFDRSDEPQPGTAVGYLAVDGLRTNGLHLPRRGVGDGGLVTTVGDVHRLWAAAAAGAIVPAGLIEAAWEPITDEAAEGHRYGRGFWLHPTGPAVALEGYDAGMSFRSVHDPVGATTHTVIANWSDGAWPLAKVLDRIVLGWER